LIKTSHNFDDICQHMIQNNRTYSHMIEAKHIRGAPQDPPSSKHGMMWTTCLNVDNVELRLLHVPPVAPRAPLQRQGRLRTLRAQLLCIHRAVTLPNIGVPHRAAACSAAHQERTYDIRLARIRLDCLIGLDCLIWHIQDSQDSQDCLICQALPPPCATRAAACSSA